MFSNTMRDFGETKDKTFLSETLQTLFYHTVNILSLCWNFFLDLVWQLKKEKAPGPDNTNLYMFKEAPKPIQRFSFHVCNTLILSKKPTDWLNSYICLVTKKGDLQCPSNYRPTALTNTVYKVVASYLNSSYSFLMGNDNIISKCQHGGKANTHTADHILLGTVSQCPLKSTQQTFVHVLY